MEIVSSGNPIIDVPIFAEAAIPQSAAKEDFLDDAVSLLGLVVTVLLGEDVVTLDVFEVLLSPPEPTIPAMLV